MLPIETTMMALHREARQCFSNNHERSSRDGMTYGNLFDHESQKIKKTVLSTTVAELCSVMKFGSCQFLLGL